jgi:hypothetical protein
MKNLVTQEYYTGSNYEILSDLGVKEVCTFKQGAKYFGLYGKQTKGLKSIAKLYRPIVITSKKTGKEVSVPKTFVVFNADDWRERQSVVKLTESRSA